MKRLGRVREKIVLHPIMAFAVLILATILISGILYFFNANTTYNRINAAGDYDTVLVTVESLLNLSGIKWIFSNAVANFATFTPLSMLLIILIGFGIMDKSGFLDTIFYLLTNKLSKKVVTFSLSLICILFGIIGDLSFLVFVPLAALLFKYGRRNPKIGIIVAFASLSCGVGLNVLMSAVDTSLIEYTLAGAHLLSPSYGASPHLP